MCTTQQLQCSHCTMFHVRIAAAPHNGVTFTLAPSARLCCCSPHLILVLSQTGYCINRHRHHSCYQKSSTTADSFSSSLQRSPEHGHPIVAVGQKAERRQHERRESAAGSLYFWSSSPQIRQGPDFVPRQPIRHVQISTPDQLCQALCNLRTLCLRQWYSLSSFCVTKEVLDVDASNRIDRLMCPHKHM